MKDFNTAEPMDTAEETEEVIVSPFHLGLDYDSYHSLGAHPMEVDGVYGTRFRVWAPHAKDVTILTSATGWENYCPLHCCSKAPPSSLHCRKSYYRKLRHCCYR